MLRDDRYHELNAAAMAALRAVNEAVNRLHAHAGTLSGQVVGPARLAPDPNAGPDEDIVRQLDHPDAVVRYRALCELSRRRHPWPPAPSRPPTTGRRVLAAVGRYLLRLLDAVLAIPEPTPPGWFGRTVRAEPPPLGAAAAVRRLATADPEARVQSFALVLAVDWCEEPADSEFVRTVARLALTTDDYYTWDAAYQYLYWSLGREHEVIGAASLEHGFSPLRYDPEQAKFLRDYRPPMPAAS